MKKLLVFVLTVSMLLGLMGCGKSTSTDRLSEIKERGYLEICMDPYFAPMEFIDTTKSGDEQYVGVDVEFANVIADKIGVELRIVPLEFTAVLVGISEGKYDLAISALAWTEERAEAMTLSNGYFTKEPEASYGFLVREEDKDKYVDIESVKDAVIITQSGSIQESLYKKYVGECKEFKLVSTMPDAFLAVSENKADVCICAVSSADLYAEANGGICTNDFRFPLDLDTAGTRVGAPKEGSDSLIELVNETIDELAAEGKFYEWREYYTEYAKSLGIE